MCNSVTFVSLMSAHEILFPFQMVAEAEGQGAQAPRHRKAIDGVP